MEPLREVHALWLEQTEDAQIEWEPDLADQYTGPNGGAFKSGPSAKMKHAVHNTKSLADIFLGILPWRFWKKCARTSDDCAYKDYVTEVVASKMTYPHLKHCRSNQPGARHSAAMLRDCVARCLARASCPGGILATFCKEEWRS